MKEFFEGGIPESEISKGVLSAEERRAILMRADARRRSQELKVDALNLAPSESTPERKNYYDRTLSRVKREADAEDKIDYHQAQEMLTKEEENMRSKVEVMSESAPNLSTLVLANLIKMEQAAGRDFDEDMEQVSKYQEKSAAIPKLSPTAILPDAILLGVGRRSIEESPMPSRAKIAEAALADEELLREYALVLPENERDEFLKVIPEDQQRRASIILDSAVSSVLHQSLVERGTAEEEQRREVRIRLFKELRSALSGTEATDRKTAKKLGNALGTLGEDARQLLLELIRDETESRKEGGIEEKTDHLPRVMKVMLDNFDDWRANDLILQTAASLEINHHLSRYLFGKLVDKGYLPKDIGEWWQESPETGDEKLKALKKVVADLGVIPSRQIMEFVCDESRWRRKRKVLNLDERIGEIKNSQAEFTAAKTSPELVRMLASDENKAMIFYMLYGGEDRFNLINNYPFERFQEMIRLIGGDEDFALEHHLTPLRIHNQPLAEFKKTLLKSGSNQEEADRISQRLQGGHFPLPKTAQAYQEVSFEASENAALKNANLEIGLVLGRQQLGVVLLFPLYREYLETAGNKQANEFLAKMQKATSFSDRMVLIREIEGAFSGFREQAKQNLHENWVKFGEKMVIEMTLDQVFSDESVPIRGEELLPRLDAKRIDLKRINKELLVLLKGESKPRADLTREIVRKKRARLGLMKGLEHQEDERKRQRIENQINQIDEELAGLETKRQTLGEIRASERFAHLSEEEREVEIDRLSREIIALTEKSPSAIFTYITMQVLGEERLRESDINLVQELESHLQGPFQTISDLQTYERPRAERKRMRVGLQYLDKCERLMTTVRFADSKICCFSSNNYEMSPGHQTPNKFWVASINADPMSFVISMEMSRGEAIERGRKVNDNIGFIFGNFGVDDEGKLAILLNGIYYAPGVEDKTQVEAILVGVERIFEGLSVKTLAIASLHGGGAVGDNLPAEYSNEPIELVRLRALDDGGGSPENRIYDDLDTGSDLNRQHFYGGHVWHKKL